jgi:protein-disulfide isomerase
MLRRMQRSRLLLVAGAAGVAIVVVVVLIAVGSRGSKHAVTTTTATTTAPVKTPKASIFAGVPQHGDTLGRASAPVTLTVFEDPQCPFCRQWDLETLPTVIERYVKTGRVKLVYRGVEIIGPNSVLGLQAVYAASRQNKLWPFSDELYKLQGAENSGWITPAVIRRAALATGADGAGILGALHSAVVRASLARAERDATAGGLQGTPTFVIERPPAIPRQLSVTALDPATFTQALDAAIG